MRQSLLAMLFLTACLSFSVFTSITAQTGLYKTYDDYKNNKIETYSNIDYLHAKKLQFQQGGQTVIEYKPEEVWGFVLQNKLFRCYQNDVFGVSIQGKVISYYYGFPIIVAMNGRNYILDASEKPTPEVLVSNELNSDIYPTHFNAFNTNILKRYKKDYTAFTEAFPQHQQLYECLADTKSDEKFDECLLKYNADNFKAARFDNDAVNKGITNITWGSVDEAEPVTATFIFTNTSGQFLEIQEVMCSPSSVQSTFDAGMIEPGKTGKINITLNPAKYLRSINAGRSLPMRYGYQGNITVQFKGVPDAKTILLSGKFAVKK